MTSTRRSRICSSDPEGRRPLQRHKCRKRCREPKRRRSLRLIGGLDPNASPIYYEITVAGQLQTSGTLQPGAYVTPTFPGTKNGPVEVQAWTDSSR